MLMGVTFKLLMDGATVSGVGEMVGVNVGVRVALGVGVKLGVIVGGRVALGVKVGGKGDDVAVGDPEGTGVSGGRQRFWKGSKNWPGGHVGVGVKVIVGVKVGVPTFGGRAGNAGVNCGGHAGPGGMFSHRTAGILST
jgi:hypothetical protein